MPIFRCMKIVSHRRAPQGTVVVHYLSVPCGALRWLFIHVKTAVKKRSASDRSDASRRPRAPRPFQYRSAIPNTTPATTDTRGASAPMPKRSPASKRSRGLTR